MVELQTHPWFIGCQFHPEFTSSPRAGFITSKHLTQETPQLTASRGFAGAAR